MTELTMCFPCVQGSFENTSLQSIALTSHLRRQTTVQSTIAEFYLWGNFFGRCLV